MKNYSIEDEFNLIAQLLTEAGIPFRIKGENEEGGIFFSQNGQKVKFTENIFVKRSMKYDDTLRFSSISINDICGEGNESEPDVQDELRIDINDDISSGCAICKMAIGEKEIRYNTSQTQYSTFDSTWPLTLDAA